MTKPCPPKVLRATLAEAVEYNRLLTAEKTLLESTLDGSIKVLTDVLALAAPAAFSRGNTVSGYVEHMAAELGLEHKWIFGLAARLAQLGCITVPPETLARHYAGQPLSAGEREMFDNHPATGAQLLANIPRLEPVAAIIGRQRQPQTLGAAPNNEEDVAAWGAAMLRLALELDNLTYGGRPMPAALRKLSRRGEHDPRLVDAMSSYVAPAESREVTRMVGVADLAPSMVVDEDVVNLQGVSICRAETSLTAPLIARLQNFARGAGRPPADPRPGGARRLGTAPYFGLVAPV